MGCSTRIVKIILNILNGLMGIFGALLLAVGTLTINLIPLWVTVFLISIGGFMFVITILGCCGICRENFFMTMLYTVLLFLLFLSEFIGIFAVPNVESVRKYIHDDIIQSWNLEATTRASMVKHEIFYNCCGVNGASDYTEIGRDIPSSCYNNNNILHDIGCVEAGQNLASEYMQRLFETQWTSIIFDGVILLLALLLVIRFRNKREEISKRKMFSVEYQR